MVPPTRPSAAVRGASLLIIVQVGSRLLTFLANQVLLRFLTAHQLGVATQLEVYYLSVLFFCRESFRVAIQRMPPSPSPSPPPKKQDADSSSQDHHTPHTQTQTQTIVNLAYLAPLVSLLLAPALAYSYHRALPQALLAETPSLATALWIYALASVVELLSEPGFALAQARLSFGVRAGTEAAAAVARCAVTIAWVIGPSRVSAETDMLPFAAGQFSYSAVLFLGYGYYTATSVIKPGSRVSGFPKPVPGDPGRFLFGLFHRPTVNLASSMTLQSVAKQLLTQGDTLLVSIFSETGTQGVYALANNYGGLLARMLFHPIEESSRSYFSRLLSATSSPPNESDTRHNDSSEATNMDVLDARSDLQAILKAYVLVSMPIVALGPLIASPLLSIVAGAHWVAAGAGNALAIYCYYLPLLAINGITEAFVSSVTTSQQVHVQSLWMAAFSCVFAATGFITLYILDWGAEGLVMANAVNMACRILWSVQFISRYFHHKGVEFDILSLRPSTISVIASLATPHLVNRIVDTTDGPLKTLLKSGISFVPLLLIMTYSERRFLINCVTFLRGQTGTRPLKLE